MFSTVLQELKGYFGRDFFLAFFSPTVIFIGANLVVYFEITKGLGNTLAKWDRLSGTTQVLLILVGMVISIGLSYIIYNFQYTVVRLFEGYWNGIPILRSLRASRVKFQRARWDYLTTMMQSAATPMDANEFMAEKLAYFPPPNHLDKMMPTRLGNILRSSEIYAYDRYGIDSTIIWSRLRPLLKPEAVATLEDKKMAMQFMLLISLFAAAFTLIWCPLLAIFTGRWQLFFLCTLGWPLAWLAYQNAIQSALAYGEQVKATFDLYRQDLLKALNRKIPADMSAERKEWLRLSRFFYRNLPIPPSPPEQTEPKGWDMVAVAVSDCLKELCRPDTGNQSGNP